MQKCNTGGSTLIRFSWRIAFLLSCLAGYTLHAELFEVVFLSAPHDQTTLRQQEEIAAQFYGLTTTTIQIASDRDALRAEKLVNQKTTLAVVVSAAALEGLNKEMLLSAVHRRVGRNVPIFIGGVSPETTPSLLRRWSSEGVVGCEPARVPGEYTFYNIKSLKAVTQELTGQRLAAVSTPVCTLIVNGESNPEALVTIAVDHREVPVFVREDLGNQEIFFSVDATSPSVVSTQNAYDQPGNEFSALAPLMMFLRYAGGDRAWHTIEHYANLTVDDPWLREPYGYLSYADLLGEMQRHKFHTTIAFIPWNFDRSQLQVVSLLRAHPDKFSICIHGNNHDHQEFGTVQERPVEFQMADIRQALARMEEFKSLTQLQYDRVMVFPHSIAPEEALEVLKEYNFLGTVNSRDIPLGSSVHADPAFVLRAMTLKFANFPSLRRYSAEISIPQSEIAVEEFLGNPMLFYVHQAYFADGVGRFDAIADTVNQIQPNILWTGLGNILEHLYLERLREDGNYDIMAFGSTLRIQNVHGEDAVFFITKEEDFRYPLSVSIDGQPFSYNRDGDALRLEIPIRAGKARNVVIEYGSRRDFKDIDTAKSSMRVASLRYLSDFRDNYVSRSVVGRGFIRLYTRYESRLNKLLVLLLLLAAFAASVLVWRVRGQRRKRRDPALSRVS